jgi:hypothetical protein
VLRQAEVERSSAAHHRRSGRRIADSDKAVHAMEPVLAAIRERRNGWLAHLDPQTIRDPKALEARAKVTMPDLERVFKETERILPTLSSLYDGTISSELRYIGWDDYEVALNWIRVAKCVHIEKYEREFQTKWDGPHSSNGEPLDLLMSVIA